jgi:hypothetical protein
MLSQGPSRHDLSIVAEAEQRSLGEARGSAGVKVLPDGMIQSASISIDTERKPSET